ncbi:MAG: RNA polymerase subunit RPABC4/transcription elongation factor Spt4, partial [Pirellulaceae bacterium]
MDVNIKETRCPNCRAVRRANEQTCRNCDWIPLQETELVFVDEEITCSECKRVRPATEHQCPDCGAGVKLKSLTKGTFNYQISGIFLVMTVIAICAAVGRYLPALGIGLLFLATLAGVRTILLVQERKRHRYPTGTNDLVRLFWGRVGGVILAGVVFVISILGESFVFGAIIIPSMYHSEEAGLAFLGLATIVAHAGAIYMLVRKLGDANWKPFIIGAVFAFVSAVVIVLVASLLPPSRFRYWNPLYELVAIAPLLIAMLGTIVCAASHGAALRSMQFFTGYSAAATLFTGFALLFGMRNPLLAALVAFGFVLWPVLLTIISLNAIWSWDDAFP